MILLIDSYDSFTNNLSRLIEHATKKEVITIHNDSVSPEQYESFLNQYIELIDYIVVGPGPGSPTIASDIGIINWLFEFFKANPRKCVPIFGICLGFQCLCYCFGNEVKKLDNVKHGQIYDVLPIIDDCLFKGLSGVLPSVRYHSLFVDINELSMDIIPLAICYEDKDTKIEKKVLMAAKHRELPLYGVQYHPESICTEQGMALLKNFDTIANKFNQSNRPHMNQRDNSLIESLRFKTEAKPLSNINNVKSEETLYVYAKEMKFDNEVSTIDICEYLIKETGGTNFVVLNSASIPGEWSMIGLPNEQSEIISHSVDSPQTVKLQRYGSQNIENYTLKGSESIWSFVADKFSEQYVSRASILSKANLSYTREFPFLGGYIGLISYEEGQNIVLKSLGNICKGDTPDLKLVFIERFVLFDNLTNKWFYFSVNTREDDTEWSEEFVNQLQNKCECSESLKIPGKLTEKEIKFQLPDENIYKQQFEQCQEYLHSGDSYELCLTTPSKIYLPSDIKTWDIYKVLVNKNPSPFSCFIDFDDVVLISSSPERFLSWKGGKTKTVELKPIKGTVKNTPDVDLIKATEILKTPKEMGENLMIVDLIRHDLHQFIEQVKVPDLMVVEEYKTVYQLVSTITGDLDNESNYRGIDILHASLPPGSMTGAPKKRSVELLQKLEELQPNAVAGGRRGIYSGVVGYWSITDESDWSVVIRSAYHYKNDKENTEDYLLWRIGAGGAITVLSELDGEWEEMHLKLVSALQAFDSRTNEPERSNLSKAKVSG